MPRQKSSGVVPNWDQLYEQAESQAGYFTLSQAEEAGFSRPLLAYHQSKGTLIHPIRGVYRLNRFPSAEGEELVCLWLWSEQKGVFSHDTALLLHNLSDILPPKIHITVPASWKKSRIKSPKGIVLYYEDLEEEDIEWKASVPVTKPRKTLEDCAHAHVLRELVAQAWTQAVTRGLLSQPVAWQTFRTINDAYE
jgi:predicted transcriptional regulator of viral defense system